MGQTNDVLANPGKGPTTRDQLLDAAERSVLAKGFGATSIEELIAEVGISKSGFIYHFKGKGALAETFWVAISSARMRSSMICLIARAN